MGGILGNKAWMRSNGGLWVPNVFGMPETVYGWCCCGEETDCGPYGPMLYDYSGQSVLVTISGVDNVSLDCQWLNDEFEFTPDDFYDEDLIWPGCYVTWRLVLGGLWDIAVKFSLYGTLPIRSIEVIWGRPDSVGIWHLSEESAVRWTNVNNATWNLPVPGTNEIRNGWCDSSEGSVTVTIVG